MSPVPEPGATTVTILAPAYNEEPVIGAFLDAVAGEMQDGWEVLIVDDGSADRTGEIVRAKAGADDRVRMVTHVANRGLGAALTTGFGNARGEVVVTMDADLSHPLQLLSRLIEGTERADAVYASRFVPGGGMPGVVRWRALISRWGNWVLRLLFWVPVHDLTTGYRAYRRRALSGLSLTTSGFETQLEITVKLAAAGARMAEIPLRLVPRAAGKSKMRYLRLIRRYGVLVLRLLRHRWFKPIQGPAESSPSL